LNPSNLNLYNMIFKKVYVIVTFFVGYLNSPKYDWKHVFPPYKAISLFLKSNQKDFSYLFTLSHVPHVMI